MTRADTTREYLATAEQAFGADEGPAALDALGWWDLLDHLDDTDVRIATFALLRAQGRQLGDSPALGGIVAHPYLDGLGADHPVVATVLRRSRRGADRHLALGRIDGVGLLVDRPGDGALLVEPGAATARPLDVPGRLSIHEVEVDPADAAVTIPEETARTARLRATFLGRLAASAEILGAAEGALSLALTHARDREQFGQAIGRFQAVRHLLAWASTDCVAVADVVDVAIELDHDAPPAYDEIVKALAGRNGRHACERSLQVLGGIGFTAEHDHHHHHARVLTLDALLGASTDLTQGLGASARDEGLDARLTTAPLLGAAGRALPEGAR